MHSAKVSLMPNISKLLITHQGAQVKLEVNQTNRGALHSPIELPLCEKAQEEFDAFCVVPVIEKGQLYGGKICAALDRQHPRDLFDVKYFLENTEFTDEYKEGLLLALLSSNRPLEELLFPHLIDQSAALANQFEGMANEPFDYSDFEATRENLLDIIHQNITTKEKDFLLSIQSLQPNWSTYYFEQFPSVQWKLYILERLSESNPKKYQKQLESLKSRLTEK